MKSFRAVGILVLCTSAAFAQIDVISARSGLIHYTEGAVFLADKQINPKLGDYPEMKDGDQLRTEVGRAEILLTPGVFLRIAENSAVRMDSNKLENTRLTLLGGSALLEVGETEKDQPIVLEVAGKTLEFAKKGLFRIDVEPARLRAYDGQAVVVNGAETVTVKEGREALLAGVIAPEKFNKEVTDPFYRWASRRAGYIAMANLSMAKKIEESNMAWRGSSWMYNPYFGAFTYLPFRGRYICPFGYSYYSPGAVRMVYYRPPVYVPQPGGGGVGMGGPVRGYSDMGGRGSSGSVYAGSVASPSVNSNPSAPAPSAAPARTGDSGGGSRESRGGR